MRTQECTITMNGKKHLIKAEILNEIISKLFDCEQVYDEMLVELFNCKCLIELGIFTIRHIIITIIQ